MCQLDILILNGQRFISKGAKRGIFIDPNLLGATISRKACDQK